MTKFFSFLSFSSLFFGVGGLNYQRRTYLKEHKWLRNLALRHREKHFYGKEPSWVCYTRIGSEIWETQMERNIWIFLERDRVRERETEKRSVSNLFTQKAKVFFIYFLFALVSAIYLKQVDGFFISLVLITFPVLTYRMNYVSVSDS